MHGIEFERGPHVHDMPVLEWVPEKQLDRHVAGPLDHCVGRVDELEMRLGASCKSKAGKGCQQMGTHVHVVASQTLPRVATDLKGRTGFWLEEGGLRRTASRQTLTPASGGMRHGCLAAPYPPRQVSWLAGLCSAGLPGGAPQWRCRRRSPLTVAGAATDLVPDGYAAPCSLFHPLALDPSGEPRMFPCGLGVAGMSIGLLVGAWPVTIRSKLPRICPKTA